MEELDFSNLLHDRGQRLRFGLEVVAREVRGGAQAHAMRVAHTDNQAAVDRVELDHGVPASQASDNMSRSRAQKIACFPFI